MAMSDLLYRCPICGADPVQGSGDEVHCPTCDTRYRRGDPPAGVVVERPGREPEHLPATELTRAIDEAGGPFPAARAADGSIRYQARVMVRRSRREDPVRRSGELLGFVERLGEGSEATLHIDGEALELRPSGEGARRRWPLLELRAVQTSSSSLQIRTATGTLVHFGFVEDSACRWQALVQGLLRRAYRRAGRGQIREFQPRIDVR